MDLGYEVLTVPVSQIAEKNFPADFLFFDRKRCKLFGLQYKALYKNGEDFWPLSADQHTTLSECPWIYYCLSELKDSSEHRIALHLTRIVNARFQYQEKILQRGDSNIKLYSRWGAFYQGLQRCTNGVVVKSTEHLKGLITRNSNNPHLTRLAEVAADIILPDIFLTDLSSKHIVHYSPFLRETDTRTH